EALVDMPEPRNDEMLQRGIISSSPRGSGGVRMRRRRFLILLGGAAAWPRTGRAQHPSGRPLIAFLAGGTEWNAARYRAAILEGLQELGYVDGRNIDLVTRYGEGRSERYQPLAEELVRLKPVVIITGAIDTAVATKNVTTTIPIVTAALADAIHLG